MSRIIYKPKADEDLYVEWSTEIEEPIFYGTRKQLSKYLIKRGKEDLRLEIDSRISRADKTSTSAYSGADKDGVILSQIAWVTIDRLGELAKYLIKEKHSSEEAVEALGLETLEDD